jgi:hypothetical protein
MYASPLYVDSVLITTGDFSGNQFSVVFAATSNNFVYAISTILWSKNVGMPTNFGLDGGIAMGILSTAIIDLNATPPTMYVAADSIDDTPAAWKVYALDIGSGDILPGGWPLTTMWTETLPARFD